MKNNYILAVISLALISYGIYNKEESNDEYEQWKQKNNKLYLGTEDQYRREIFHQNLKLVNEHNLRYEQGLETFSLDTNLFADLTFEEFSALYLYSTYKDQDVKQNVKSNSTNKYQNKTSIMSYDWSTVLAGYPEVYSQGKCLASWAFAVAGSIEIAFYLGEGAGAIVQRSPQYLINCVNQANPCLEGSVSNTWAWANNSLLYSEDDVPYTGQKDTCSVIIGGDGFQIKNYVTVDGPFQYHIDYYSHIYDGSGQAGNAVVVSPISVSDIKFQLYKDGIYDGACGTNLNYDALVVGYDDTGSDATSFYKLRMSWSQEYGQNGYIKVAMATECLYTKLSYAK